MSTWTSCTRCFRPFYAPKIVSNNVPLSFNRTFTPALASRAKRVKRAANKEHEEDTDVNFFVKNSSTSPLQRLDHGVNIDGGNDELSELVESLRTDLEEAKDEEKQMQGSLLNHMKEWFSGTQLRAARDMDPDHMRNLFNAHHVDTDDPLPMQARSCLAEFNKAMDSIEFRRKSNGTFKAVWLWYLRCKENVPGFLRMIPRRCWDILWQSQIRDTSPRHDRTKKIHELIKDKLSAGLELSENEALVQLECLFTEGHKAEAIQGWAKRFSEQNEGLSQRAFESGIRLYTAHGDLNEAESLALSLFAAHSIADGHILLPIIRKCCESGSSLEADRAFKLYCLLRERLGKGMKMQEFDVVITSFLAGGFKNYALACFRDMMLLGESQTKGMPGFHLEALNKVRRYVHNSTDAQDANAFSIEALTYLPRRFQNKYFYASWMRKLISEGKPDLAATVVELMYERGSKPDTRHMNGLISGWLRMGNNMSRRKAEELGWAMIQKRLDFVAEREVSNPAGSTTKQTRVRKIAPEVDSGTKSLFLERPVPAANIETCGILLQHYLKKNQFSHARHVRNILQPAELEMNAFFMNHLLYAELRTGGYQRTWNRFEIIRHSVTADVVTWTCLWQCVKQHGESLQIGSTDFPSPRELFAQTMSWFNSLRGQSRREAMEGFDTDFSYPLVQAFCAADDLDGCFVALHQMRYAFHIFPDDRIGRQLVSTVARKNTPRGARAGRTRRPAQQQQRRKYTAEAAAALDAVRQQRMIDVAELHSKELTELSHEQQAEERFRTIMTWLLVGTRAERESSEQCAAIRAACDEMGVGQFEPESCADVVEP